MLHAFHLRTAAPAIATAGSAPAKWQAEHDAGRALFSGFGGRKLPDAPPTDVKDTGVANTNIIFHGGRLLALEEGHLPDRAGHAEHPAALATTAMVEAEAHDVADPTLGWCDSQVEFEFTLDLLLDGLERLRG